ncbi:MAG: MG2 domain-containing protein, partial [Bacteroidota bacterium]
LQSKTLSVQVEEVILPGTPFLVSAAYRNVDKLYYRVVAKEFSLKKENPDFESGAFRRLITGRARLRGEVSLAANDDYKEHRTELGIDGLQPGHYFLLVGTDPSFDAKRSPIALTYLEVSSLALLAGNNPAFGLVVDRKSGAALSGVEAIFYEYTGNYRNRKLVQIGRGTSQANGEIDLLQGRSVIVELRKGEDRAASRFYVNDRPPRKYTQEKTDFFLDRGIYRPGQTLYVKGISIAHDEKRNASILTNEEQEIYIYDANGQEVGKQTVTTDEFGAFDLSFILPESGLNGQYNITSSIGGRKNFRVEAYKRPHFEVVFEPNDEPVAPGDSTTVTGKAIGFAGPAVTDATVTYQVSRESISYFYYYRGPGGGGAQDAVLATGTTTTDDQGEFSIDFAALVPPAQKNRYGQHYRFVVSVDVADITGETHAAKAYVQLRKKDIRMELDVPAMLDVSVQDSLLLRIRAAGDLAEEGKNTAPAEVQIQAVTHPEPALFYRKWSIPDRPTISESTFRKQFPQLAYAATPSVEEWTNAGDPILTRSVEVEKELKLNLPIADLRPGHYRIRLQYQANGEERAEFAHLEVLDSQEGALPAGMFYYFDRDYQQVTPGETITLPLVCQENLPLVLSSWGSRETKRLYERSQVNNRHLFTHDVTDGDRGVLYFQYEFVKHNRYFRGQKRITVTWPTKKLAIEYETFRDKLRPGEEEEWRIRIDDHEGGPASAQVLASMYDASLDQLASYEWGFWPHQSYAGARNRLSSTGFSVIYGYGIYNNPGRPPRRSYIAPGLLLGPLNFWGGGYYYPTSYALEDVENHDLNPYRGDELESSAMAAPKSAAPPPPPAESVPEADEVDFDEV